MFKTTNYLLFKSLNQLNDINRSYMGKKVACLLLPARKSRETMQIEAVMQRLVSTSFPGRQFNRRSTLAQLASTCAAAAAGAGCSGQQVPIRI